MKKIVVSIIVIIVLAFILYQVFLKKPEVELEFTEVIRGDVFQEVSEVGKVKKGEEVNLSSKSAGTIEKIYVSVGEKVKSGDTLAKLEDTQLRIQLQEAKANLSVAQANLDKLLAGATPEEIQIARTSVENAQIALGAAEKNLDDVKAKAEENLRADYEDALNTLDDSYLKIQNAYNTANFIQRTYFTKTDQEGTIVRENENKIEAIVNQVKPYLESAKNTQEYGDIDTALSEISEALDSIAQSLKIIRENCDSINYRNAVSSTDKTSLDTQRGYINTALTNVNNSQQTISLTRLTNTANINTAQSQVDSARGSLRKAEDELAKILAPPRKEDIDLYRGQLGQSEAKVQLLIQQIEETVLKVPVDGQVIKIQKRVGEVVQPALQDTVISVLPDSPFEITVDIYEEDVAKMRIGNPVDISLVAFPDQTLKGKVISIDPAEKIIEGVVYYEVTITFEELIEGILPGMTADLIIKIASRENVLAVSEDAIEEKNGKTVVQVLSDSVSQEREIEVGLQGSNDLVEVISGLSEGERVIIP